jgi:DNA ligase (NAD+)
MESLINNIIKDPYNYSMTLTVDSLEKVIKYTADKFFNDKSVISDQIYDLLIDFLRHKDPKNKFLKQVGSEVKSKDKVKLDYYLGSMDKIKPPSNQLDKWVSKYNGPYVLSEKLDGVSGLLIYKRNGDIKLYTRGTATHGVNITPLVKYITQIPSFDKIKEFLNKNKIKSTHKENLIAFRGEIIINKSIFESKWASTKSNARNTVSGVVNSKRIDPILAGSTYFVVYEIVDPHMKLLDQLKMIDDMGFRAVHSKVFDKINYENLSAYLKKRKASSKYVIDGIIVSNNELYKRNTTGNPEYAFAFKDILEDQKAISTIVEVEWKVSKDGYINPIVIIEPVEIGGVTITRITAYNARFVVDNKLGIGAQIELIRSGDVIPKILKVIKPTNKVVLPDSDWEWNETKVDIILKGSTSKEMEIKNIHYFFATLDTKGMGEKVVEKIYDSGLKTIKDILDASKSDFLKADGFQEKSAENIVKSIKKAMSSNNSNSSGLSILMSASNQFGHGMGQRRMDIVLEKYPKILEDHKKWTSEEFINKIKELPGWEEKTSQQLVSKFPNFITFYKSLKDHVKLKPIVAKKINKTSKLSGKTIVLSGFRDKDLENKLKELDIKVGNSISKNTDLLVVKDKSIIDENTGKVKKAVDAKVKIITKEQLLKEL